MTRALLICAITISPLFGAQAFAAPPAYWMSCMGGPSAAVFDYPDPAKAPYIGGPARVVIRIDPAPDMTSPMAAGQCRWLDRILNSREKGAAVLFYSRPPAGGSDVILYDPVPQLADKLLAYARAPSPYQIRAYHDGTVFHITNVRR